MPRIVTKFVLAEDQLPDFTAVCTRKQDLKMRVWRVLLCDNSVIFDINCSMKQPHNTQVGRQVLTINLAKLTTITADKSYDWDAFRYELRDAGIRPVTKRQEFSELDKAHNVRHNENIYHRRSIVEAIFFTLKNGFGETLRTRTWFGQFREFVLKGAVRKVEHAVRV